MGTLNSKKLDEASKYYLAVEGIIKYAENEAKRRSAHNLDFLETIKFPFVGELAKNKQDMLDKRFTEISEYVKEAAVLSIVAAFEKIVFEKISKSSALIKEVVKEGYLNPQPMHSFKKSFIKEATDVENLYRFNQFFVEHPEHSEEFEELKEIINYRNYLAHGKREGVGSPSNKTVIQIIEKLDNILTLCGD